MESNGLIAKLTDLGIETKYLKEAVINFRFVIIRSIAVFTYTYCAGCDLSMTKIPLAHLAVE